MAFEFHKDAQKRFDQQYENAKLYVLPFIDRHFPVKPGMRVLEIGCGECGVLKAFTDEGCITIGVDLEDKKIEAAKSLMEEEIKTGKLQVISEDIFKIDLEKDLGGKFDLILLKDTIEHIHGQESFIPSLKPFLNPGGHIFFGFPPWYMPFGGHQQVTHHKMLSKLPYYHLLPMPVYTALLKAFGESQQKVENLREIKELGISIERFQRIVKKSGFRIAGKQFYLFNPIYKYKFGWQPRKQNKLIGSIPFLRNFFTTTVYYLITPKG